MISFHQLIAGSLLAAALLPSAAQAQGTALNQLCGAAGYGSGCVGAFKVPAVPRMSAPGASPRVGGGAFGGMGGILMGMILEQALSSALDSVGDAEAAEGAQTTAAPQHVRALQEAVRQQQKLEEERQATFYSQLLDRPASEFIGSSQDLGILETARAEAGSPFDGNDPHATWATLHDVWFSPESTGSLRAGSNPVPVGDGVVAPSLRPIECIGRLCSFPPGSAHVPIVKTASTGIDLQRGLSGSSSRVPGVLTEWRQVGNRAVWAARRDLADALETAREPQISADVLGFGAVNWAQQALPGMQQEIAREGRDIYQRVMEELIGETFGVLSDAASGRWQEALERSDTIGDRVRESILPQFKMARLILAGDGEGAGQFAGDAFWDRAKEVAKERAKEVLDILPGPEWVREGAGQTWDIADHWIQGIGPQ